MKAIILAGGSGTRLRPVTYEIPKPLIPVKKKPIINHLIELFARHGIREVGILASRAHTGDFERWRKTWKEDLPSEQLTMFFEEKPRGTFGGLEYAKNWLGTETFFVSNGDELKDFNLENLLAFHRKEGAAGTIALVRVSNPHEYGVPIMNSNRIKEFLEKPRDPPSDFVSSGLYVLEPGVLEAADFSNEVIMFEKDIFPRLAEEGKLAGFRMEPSRWYDCGNLERWEKAMREW